MTEHADATYDDLDRIDNRRHIATDGRIKVARSEWGAAITVYYDDERSHVRIHVSPEEAQFIADNIGADHD